MFVRVVGSLASSSSDLPMYNVDKNMRLFAWRILDYSTGPQVSPLIIVVIRCLYGLHVEEQHIDK